MADINQMSTIFGYRKWSVNKYVHLLLKATWSPEPSIHILDNLKTLHSTIREMFVILKNNPWTKIHNQQ